jgi:hypothetical protein
MKSEQSPTVMKTAKEAYYHQGLFRYSEKGWPEKPTKYQGLSTSLYQQALSAAIDKSVPFEDQRVDQRNNFW